jgi:hypothetical protein
METQPQMETRSRYATTVQTPNLGVSTHQNNGGIGMLQPQRHYNRNSNSNRYYRNLV